MLISKGFGAYNDRRYSRPWGATVKFAGAKPVYTFGGHWSKTDYQVFIEAQPGTIVAFGQKDLRKPRSSENCLYLVEADGSLTEVTESEARKALAEFTAAQPAALVTEVEQVDPRVAAIAEVKRLMALYDITPDEAGVAAQPHDEVQA